MKRFYILTILFALAVISTSAQVSKLVERYSDSKGVTSVYISKTMIGMMPDLSTNGLEFKGMADKLNSIRVLKKLPSTSLLWASSLMVFPIAWA